MNKYIFVQNSLSLIINKAVEDINSGKTFGLGGLSKGFDSREGVRTLIVFGQIRFWLQ